MTAITPSKMTKGMGTLLITDGQLLIRKPAPDQTDGLWFDTARANRVLDLGDTGRNPWHIATYMDHAMAAQTLGPVIRAYADYYCRVKHEVSVLADFIGEDSQLVYREEYRPVKAPCMLNFFVHGSEYWKPGGPTFGDWGPLLAQVANRRRLAGTKVRMAGIEEYLDDADEGADPVMLVRPKQSKLGYTATLYEHK